jgi:hypothetical protein
MLLGLRRDSGDLAALDLAGVNLEAWYEFTPCVAAGLADGVQKAVEMLFLQVILQTGAAKAASL